MPLKENKNNPKITKTAGWILSESILFELDLMLSLITGYINPTYFEGIAEWIQKMDSGLLKELRTLLPGNRQQLFALCQMAIISEKIYEVDYKKASVAVRKMTISDLLNIQIQQLAPFSIFPDPKHAPLEQFIDLKIKAALYTEKQTGVDFQDGYLEKSIKETALFINKIVKNGELEYDFWHCLDRFYYENYLPWRKKNNLVLEQQWKKATQILGKHKENNIYPHVNTLKKLHYIFQRTDFINGLINLKSKIHFVITPFIHFDLSYYVPGYSLFTIFESAWKHEKYVHSIDDLAKMTKAISDPTRLSILRIVRQAGSYTTELAGWMNISRPTVSEHCKILRNAGLIETYQKGRKSYHRLKPKNVKKLLYDLEVYLDLPDSEN